MANLVESEYSYDRDKYNSASKLLIFAWLIEIMAALIGLSIAGLTILTIRFNLIEEEGSISVDGYMSMFLGALPFIMVAAVELTKIPLATAMMAARNWVWKLVFATGLVFLMVITFETVINGFEQNFTTRTYQISQLRKNLVQTEENIAKLSGDMEEFEGVTADILEEGYREQVALIQSERDGRLADIDRQLAQESEKAANTNTDTLQTKIDTLTEDINAKREEKKSALQTLRENSSKDVDSQRQNIQNQIAQALLEKQSLSDRIARTRNQLVEEEAKETGGLLSVFTNKNNDDATATLRDSIQTDEATLKTLNDQIAQLNKQITAINAGNIEEQLNAARDRFDEEIRRLEADRNNVIAQVDQRIRQANTSAKPVLDGLRERREAIVAASTSDMAAAKALLDEKLSRLDDKTNKAEGIQASINTLEEERLGIRNLINEKAQSSQIYRIAALWTGKDAPSDVTNEELRWVSFIWFGSLAAIVALTGTLLAIASIVMKNSARIAPPATNNSSKHVGAKGLLRRFVIARKGYFYARTAFYKSMRRLVVARQRAITKPKIRYIEIEKEVPKEIVREVPVDKVVTKEVPKEVIRKELVYVPLYSRRPDIAPIQAAELAKAGVEFAAIDHPPVQQANLENEGQDVAGATPSKDSKNSTIVAAE